MPPVTQSTTTCKVCFTTIQPGQGRTLGVRLRGRPVRIIDVHRGQCEAAAMDAAATLARHAVRAVGRLAERKAPLMFRLAKDVFMRARGSG